MEIATAVVTLSDLGCTYSERAGLLDAQITKLREIVARSQQGVA